MEKKQTKILENTCFLNYFSILRGQFNLCPPDMNIRCVIKLFPKIESTTFDINIYLRLFFKSGSDFFKVFISFRQQPSRYQMLCCPANKVKGYSCIFRVVICLRKYFNLKIRISYMKYISAIYSMDLMWNYSSKYLPMVPCLSSTAVTSFSCANCVTAHIRALT